MCSAEVDPMKLSEKDKQALFVVLAVLAIVAVAYALFLTPAPDRRSADGSEFYFSLTNSSTVGFLFDVRGATADAQKSAIYQCGVNMISAGRFAGKTIETVACDGSGCIAASSSSNGSATMSFGEAQKAFSGMPYIYVLAGDGAPAFFMHHMEIYIPANITGNVTCDISATES